MSNIIALILLYAKLCYLAVARAEAFVFMDKFNILNIFAAILAGCAITVV